MWRSRQKLYENYENLRKNRPVHYRGKASTFPLQYYTVASPIGLKFSLLVNFMKIVTLLRAVSIQVKNIGLWGVPLPPGRFDPFTIPAYSSPKHTFWFLFTFPFFHIHESRKVRVSNNLQKEIFWKLAIEEELSTSLTPPRKIGFGSLLASPFKHIKDGSRNIENRLHYFKIVFKKLICFSSF